MKKFSIKSLLVLVLVLVLCFSLVACGNKDDDNNNNSGGGGGGGTTTTCENHPIDEDGDGKCDDCGKATKCKHTADKNEDGLCDKCKAPMPEPEPEKYNAAQFFQGLWDSAAPIGQTAISDTEDVALDLGLNVAIGKGDEKLLDLGVEVGVVLDRTGNGANSAARVKLYDHDHAENWITLYFFLNDPYFIYVDWADQHLKIGADFGFNNTWAATVNGFVGQPVIGEMSIADLLNSIAGGFGEKWNLDGLINSLTGLFGLNLGELLTSGTVAELLPMINNVLSSLADNLGIEDYEGLDVEALAESDAIVLDLLKAVGPILFSETSVVEDGNKVTYKAGLDFGDTGILSSVMPLLGGMLPAGVGDLLNNVNELAFEYVAVDNEIDNFAILVGVDTDDEPLSVEIGINEIALTGVNADNNTFGIDKKDYKSEYALDLALDVDISEGALVLYGKDLAGDYKLQVTGMVDLVNVENNTSVLEVKITDGADELARATYANGTLAAKFNAENAKVQLFLGEIGPMIVNAFATAVRPDGTADELLQDVAVKLANAIYTTETDFNTAAEVAAAYQDKHNAVKNVFKVDPTFKGVALTNIKLVNLFTGLFDGTPSYGTASAINVIDWSPDIIAILTLASKAFDGNIKDGLTLSVDGVGATIASLFAEGNGPQSNEEFCYGNGKEIVGVFEAVVDEKYEYNEDGSLKSHTIASRDGGKAADDWFASVVGQSNWAKGKDGKVIAAAFASDVELFVQIKDGKATLKVTVENSGDSIVIGLSANVKAGSAPTITPVDTEGFVSFEILA